MQQRTIKFRAWHTLQKKMYSADEMATDQLSLLPTGIFINVSSISTALSELVPEMTPMQYIGLNDKNGKEIYEADIAQRNGHIYVIKYVGSSFILSIPKREVDIGELCERYIKGSAAMHYYEDVEVIGNIYENPL